MFLTTMRPFPHRVEDEMPIGADRSSSINTGVANACVLEMLQAVAETDDDSRLVFHHYHQRRFWNMSRYLALNRQIAAKCIDLVGQSGNWIVWL